MGTRRHGTRSCYVFGPGPGRGKGCRCFDCRVANAQTVQRLADGRRKPWRVRGKRDSWYVIAWDDSGEPVWKGTDRDAAYNECARLNWRDRKPDPVWLSFKEEDELRAHLKWLRKRGLSDKAIARASRVNRRTVVRIRLGRDPERDRDRGGGYRVRHHTRDWIRIRRPTADRLLAVTLGDAGNCDHIDAGPTWELLETLLRAGYPKAQIARALGAKVGALQINRRKVRGSTARRVRELYERLYYEDPRVRLAAEGATFRRRIRDRWGTNGQDKIQEEVASIVPTIQKRERNRRNTAASRERERERLREAAS